MEPIMNHGFSTQPFADQQLANLQIVNQQIANQQLADQQAEERQEDRKPVSYRVLMLITTPKQADRAEALLRGEKMPVHFHMLAEGTASSELMDTLGLVSKQRVAVVSMMPKDVAAKVLYRLRRELKVRSGQINSGIAFTIPLTAANNILLRVLSRIELTAPQYDRKDGAVMSDKNYTLIAVIVNQGYCEAVMEAARAAGAGGGTVMHGRRIVDEHTSKSFGLDILEEKETVLILAKKEKKLDIMEAIGAQCGILTDAKGIVLSMPVDAVIGLDSDD